jgi:hypothetical protein
VVEVDGLAGGVPLSKTNLWLEVEDLEILDHAVAFFYHIDDEAAITVLILGPMLLKLLRP